MWIPRAWLLFVIVATAAFGYEFFWLNASNDTINFNVEKFRFFLTLTGLVVGVLGPVIGLAGFLASFGLELTKTGRFRPTSGLYGRFVETMVGPDATLCNVSLISGLLLSVTIAVVIVGIVLWTVLSNADAAELARMLAVAIIMGKIMLALGVTIGVLVLAFTYARQTTFYVIMAGTFGFIGYLLLTNGFSAFPDLYEFAEVMVPFGVIVGGLVGGFMLTKWAFKRLGIYTLICPVRDRY